MLKWLWLSALVAVLDQISKYWIVDNLSIGETIIILPFLEFTYIHNAGVAFGMGQNGGMLTTGIFIGISILVSLLIANWIRGLVKGERMLAIGLSIILGGAVGNVMDRFLHTVEHKRGVVDFIHVYIGSNDYFPWVFNLADTAITIGVAIIVFYEVFLRRKHTETNPEQ